MPIGMPSKPTTQMCNRFLSYLSDQDVRLAKGTEAPAQLRNLKDWLPGKW